LRAPAARIRVDSALRRYRDDENQKPLKVNTTPAATPAGAAVLFQVD
jgi:hypothetical protein